MIISIQIVGIIDLITFVGQILKKIIEIEMFGKIRKTETMTKMIFYLYIPFFAVFLSYIYAFFIADVLLNFTQLFAHKIFFAIITRLSWNSFTHNSQYTGHIINTTATTYLHLMDSAKLSVDNPHSCLLWQADSSLNSCATDRAGYFLDPSEIYKHNSFITKET